MEAREELKKYEQYLVQALLDQDYRRETETLESLQLFVGNMSVGSLECDSQLITEKVFQIGPSPAILELRSSSGLPIGSCAFESQKPIIAQFQAGNYRIELDLQPAEDKNIVHLKSKNLLAIPAERLSSESGNETQQVVKHESSPWAMLALAAQIILAAGVVFLVADRFAQTPKHSNEGGQLVASQDQQLQEVIQQLTTIQNRLDQTPVVAVKSSTDGAGKALGTTVVGLREQSQNTGSTLLEKKAVSFEEGLLESRPVWVRFKKDVEDTRRESFFKEVSAQDQAQMGQWHSFNLNVPKSETSEKMLEPFSKKGDIEIITTSVVTRHVQVRFKKDIDDNKVNGFFEEIRVKREEPMDNWYNVNLLLPETLDPHEFIGSLRSGNIVEKLNVKTDELPAL